VRSPIALFWSLVALLVVAFAASVASSQGGAPQAPAEPERWSVVRCGTLLAVPGRPVMEGATVFCRNGLIEAVVERGGRGLSIPAGAEVTEVDLSDSFVLPGLIDCHVHITNETARDARLMSLVKSDADNALDGVVYARRTLEAGFTTVRDVGSMGDACLALRDAINAGKVVGPRILSSAKGISPTGGHGDRTNGWRDDLFDVPGAAEGIADGPDAARQAVRFQVRRGADLIKITATGGVLSNIGAGVEQQMFEDELEAIVETARLLNKKVAAHAHGVNGIKAALRAGVDSIEHGTYLDDEAISLFRSTGAWYVPTITAGVSVAEFAQREGYYPAAVVPKALEVGPKIQDAFARAYKGGVKIAFGTDAGVFPHGENAREFVYMVEAGMPAEQAIVAATLNAAELCGISSEAGSIEQGKRADLIAVNGDPRRDIGLLKSVSFVMRSGTPIKQNP